MTVDKEPLPPQSRMPRCIPYVAGAVALAFYFFTLAPGVTYRSLAETARISGWNWHTGFMPWRPVYVAPLFSLLTEPLSWLPGAWKPFALNLFSALCAALTLALLVRSVSLLPHDRTREQRQREADPSALLSLPESWLPPIFAALVCGLQLTFWEHATAGSVEMFDLLIFSWLIYCVLKFRMGQNQKWLDTFVLSYGAGACNNWALIGFFPLFLAALIWIKGLEFFRPRFLARMAIFSLAGLSFYLAQPIVGAISGDDLGFWGMLQTHLGQQKFLLKSIPRWLALFLSLPTVIALFFIGIRWPSFSGEMSALGDRLGDFLFRLVHIVFLVFCLWYFLDYKFSPRVLFSGASFLSFYYMAALSAGYFIGYVLLVCRRAPVWIWMPRGIFSKWMDRCQIAAIWVAFVVLPLALFGKNFPHIRAAGKNALPRFAIEMARGIPDKPCVILSDDPYLIYLLQSAWQAVGIRPQHILLETASLGRREYLFHLRQRHPEFQKLIAKPEFVPAEIDSMSIAQLLVGLAQQHPVYYLHPSFGYFFERFNARPRGLVSLLAPSSAGVLNAPPLTGEEIKLNQEFWAHLDKTVLADLPAQAKLSSDPALAAAYYARTRNFYAVMLQRQNLINEAGAHFAECLKLNPNNIAAGVNLQFNARLRAGRAEPLTFSEDISSALSRYPTWDSLLNLNGAFDEPGFNLQIAEALAHGRNPCQAAALFERNLKLNPTDPRARIGMAKCAAVLGLPDKTIEMVRIIRASGAETNLVELTNLEALAWTQKRNYAKAEELFLASCKENPKDIVRIAVLADFYRSTGYDAMRSKETDVARRRFQAGIARFDEALAAINQRASQDDAAFETECLLKKAELQVQIDAKDDAINTLGIILRKNPVNPVALMNRATIRLMAGKLAEAKLDYLALRKLLPPSTYSVYYGLGEIAFRQKDRAAAIENFTLYLKHAPKMTPEYNAVSERLKQLQKGG